MNNTQPAVSGEGEGMSNSKVDEQTAAARAMVATPSKEATARFRRSIKIAGGKWLGPSGETVQFWAALTAWLEVIAPTPTPTAEQIQEAVETARRAGWTIAPPKVCGECGRSTPREVK